MKKILFAIAFLMFSCSSEGVLKKAFMSTCNADGQLEEYCECIYTKLVVKYSHDWKKIEAHDWTSEETQLWVQECNQ